MLGLFGIPKILVCHCERGEASNRVGIPCLLLATLALLARNDNWNLVMLSVSETSLLDSMFFDFL